MSETVLPPLAMLRSFEAAARRLSFSAAGRELNVTHVAVSQQVRRLEDHLGVALMTRDGRKLALTHDGERLAARLIESFDILRGALAEFTETNAARPLKLTVTPMFAATWLMPRLAEFRAQCPQVELMLNPTPELIDLRRDDYDLAIRFGAGDWPGLESERFIHSSFVVVAAPTLVAGVRLETPEDLLALPWLLQQGSDEFDTWLAAHHVSAPEKHDLTHLPGYMILPAARDGQGIALASQVLVAEDLAAGRLVTLFEEDSYGGARAGYYIVYRPGPMRGPVKDFVRWIKAAAEEETAAPGR